MNGGQSGHTSDARPAIQSMPLSKMNRSSRGLGKRPAQTRKATAPKQEWVSTIHDLNVHRATPEELGRDQAARSVFRAARSWPRVKGHDQAPVWFPNVTVAPDSGPDPELPVRLKPEPPTQLSLLSQSVMDTKALNELEDGSDEEYSEEESDPLSSMSRFGQLLQREAQVPFPSTPSTPTAPGPQAALNATVAVRRVRSRQSQCGGEPVPTQVGQFLKVGPAAEGAARKAGSNNTSRQRCCEALAHDSSNLSGNQSSLSVLQCMLGEVEAELDAMECQEPISTSAPQKGQPDSGCEEVEAQRSHSGRKLQDQAPPPLSQRARPAPCPAVLLSPPRQRDSLPPHTHIAEQGLPMRHQTACSLRSEGEQERALPPAPSRTTPHTISQALPPAPPKTTPHTVSQALPPAPPKTTPHTVSQALPPAPPKTTPHALPPATVLQQIAELTRQNALIRAQLQQQSAAARRRLLELIEEQTCASVSAVSPSVSPIPPPCSALAPLMVNAGSISPLNGAVGENRASAHRTQVDRLKDEGWFALSNHVQ
ncbi:hypothetical protein JZ751_027627 [Albula glossodonta]|uniref:Spindle and centriole-associated protein 1 n=1 Tax=Albula glossodonta TaxID=121402 RepID=A0A8T2MX27_9TELE|nr:hypothetical protein JZ751_027627 [Albula glossodonta]